MMFSRELPTHLVTRRSVALALASEHRHGQDCGAQVERLGKFPVRREVAENTDIGEHHLGGKFRRFPAEQRRQAPSGVEGDRSPVRRCGGRFPRPRISEPCASAPAQAVPLQNLQRFLAGRDRQCRQQEPRLAAQIFLFFDMNQRKPDRLRLPCGRREIHHAPAQGDPCVAGLPSVFGFLATGTVTGGRISRRCRTGSARTLSNGLGRSLPSLRSCFARTSNISELALNGEQEIAFPSPHACRRARRQVSPAAPVRCVSQGCPKTAESPPSASPPARSTRKAAGESREKRVGRSRLRSSGTLPPARGARTCRRPGSAPPAETHGNVFPAPALSGSMTPGSGPVVPTMPSPGA